MYDTMKATVLQITNSLKDSVKLLMP